MISSRHVYVVDDDEAVLASVQAILGSLDFQVHAYSDPKKFLQEANPVQIGCVVTDLKMPGLSGRELQDQLIAEGSTMGVVVVTGYADVASTVSIMENGAITVLEKPYNPPSLCSAVARALAYSHNQYQKRERRKLAQQRLAEVDTEEMEVMRLAIHGLPIKAISQKLELSQRTVDRRRQAALEKSGCASVGEFALLLSHIEDNLS
jgi:FixJ family two-component response regulator